MALLVEETGGDVRALKSQKTKKAPTSSSSAAPTPKDAGQLDIDSRRAAMVSTFQQTEVFRTILKPLEEMTATGRTLAQPTVKLRTTELAESGTVYRTRDMAEVKTFAKRALIVTGISPTKYQVDAAAEVWQALWSCSRPAVIVTGEAGVGKSAILLAMPKMAEHVDITNRKLNRMLKKNAAAEKKKQDKVVVDDPEVKGQAKLDASKQHPNASPLDPTGAVFEPPVNARGAAPYRRIVNRQVPFVAYVSATASFRKAAAQPSGDGGTVASGASGSSKGTKATTISDASNVSGASSDGGASVFSQRSAATKSSSATKSSKGGASPILTGKSGGAGIPRSTIEGSAFVIPAQEIEVMYTGGCSAEHLIGSTDDKGSWLDGLLLRRLRVLAEGVRGGGAAGIARSRHRARGAGTGDVCIPPAGKATSGFSHGCKSRLLVLDGPISRLLEGMLAGDHSSGPPVTEQEESGHNARCLLLPDGEALALDAWGHVAVETGDVRHLSPSTITGVAVVHLRADGPALIKGMREAWLKKQSRKRFQHPATSGGAFRPALLTTISEFFRQEGLAEGGCCLEGTGDAQKAVYVEPCTPASTCASRMRNTLLLLEGLLDTLVQIDEHAVVWEPEVGDYENGPGRPTQTFNNLAPEHSAESRQGARPSTFLFITSRTILRRSLGPSKTFASIASSYGRPDGAPSTPASKTEPGTEGQMEEAESGASEAVGASAPVATVIAQQNDLSPSEIQEIDRRLRLRAFLLCVYASLWGLGGHLVGDAARVMCSAYIRQSSPFELREHIRESNLFNFVVDINRSKLIPIGEDASACPGALPRGMWTLDRHWATQASELSCPLPPSLVIPSDRLSSVAAAAYTLLGIDGARVLVEGPSGAGKTALLSHLLKVMGKGIPDVATEEVVRGGVSRKLCSTDSSAEPKRGEASESTSLESRHAKHAAIGPVDGMKSEDRIGKRIHALDCARRQMAVAGATAAAACLGDAVTTESGAAQSASRGRDTKGPQTKAADLLASSKDGHSEGASNSRQDRHALPLSTVYLSMRRLARTEDVTGVIARALGREKDGVLEPPPGSGTVVFLDDVHFGEEPAGDGHNDSPCPAYSCAVETIRGMIDGYKALGEVRVSSTAKRRRTRSSSFATVITPFFGNNLFVADSQVHPDFAPRAPAGPDGDSLLRPTSMAVLAARTRGCPTAGEPGLAAHNSSLRHTIPASGAMNDFSTAASAAAPSHLSQAGVGRRGGPVGEFSTVPTPLNPSSTQDAQQLRQPRTSSSFASSSDRLLRRFCILALDAPSSAELRSVFSRACNGAFSVDGPVFSAVGASTTCPSGSAKSVLITSEVWKAIDAMGGVAAEFLHRLHQRLRKESSLRPTSSSCGNGARGESLDGRRPAGGVASRMKSGERSGLSACRLDYFALGRLLRPLVLGRTGDISTPTAVQRLFCHEIIREIVEPLHESRQRHIAMSELAQLIREKSPEIGIDTMKEEDFIDTWQPKGTEAPPIWTNTRGLVMSVAYWEQQATKAIISSKSTGERHGTKGGPGPQPHSGDNVAYVEVCSKTDQDARKANGTRLESNKHTVPARTMVAHGVLMNTKDVFSLGAIAEHFARAAEMLQVPWPARPDSRPLVTPQDVNNICKCLRQLSLPWNPLVLLRLENGGISREGGPESAFRLACALEGAGVVVMDAGAGRMQAKARFFCAAIF
ncbi:unnamed protein product [Scytosiphon promiscuus]